MPISKCLQKSEPLWKGWDQKAQKNGLRHQVYTVSGDCYVGEWKDNVKHGEWGTLGGSVSNCGVWTKKTAFRAHWGHKICPRGSSKG